MKRARSTPMSIRQSRVDASSQVQCMRAHRSRGMCARSDARAACAFSLAPDEPTHVVRPRPLRKRAEARENSNMLERIPRVALVLVKAIPALV